MSVTAQDKHGKPLAIGDAVTVAGVAGVVRQLIVDHPQPPPEFMEHARHSVLVEFGHEERTVPAADVERA